MKKGPIVTVLILGGVGLFLMPAIHAAVREANVAFAMGIAGRGAGSQGSQVAEFGAALTHIPNSAHWVGFAAGAACLGSGIWMALRDTPVRA